MLHEPELLLLDEPTAGVDPNARRDFWEELHALAARGISVLVSTHYMDEAERCHKLAYIAYGKLLAQGTAEEIIASQELTTWDVTGGDLDRGRRSACAAQPGVEQVAAVRLDAARDRTRRGGARSGRCAARPPARPAARSRRRPAWRTCSST